ncbi:hypothetical protein [Rhodococcoides kyotonense]|uniref:Sigma-70, region 4 n=1 Tax=Rhodococcoides kyotonense TaxID=398843 RepID=A0A239E1H9_9NOCA|nr:hypothetical protein [Rhodococcus kyotonensis]SNS38546.1 hypothetical protein SAMN05421642_102154 [Rhodococcus kyotonensis]
MPTHPSPIVRTSKPADEVEAFLDSCSATESMALREITFADDPISTAELASRLRVSPDHASKIENRSRTRAFDALRNSAGLRELGDRMLQLSRPVAALSRAVRSTPELSEIPPSLQIPLWSLISRIDERIRVESGWVLSGTYESARALLVDTATRHATIDSVTSLYVVAESFDMPAVELAEFAGTAGYRVLEGHLVPLDVSVAGQLVSILALAGAPTTMAQLMERMQPRRSESSVRNALVSDARFTKTDRTLWSLTRWAIAPYVPIHRQIACIVDERGSIEFDRLVAEIKGSYDVKEHSIRTYASTGEFAIENDIVRRRRHTYTPRKSPSKTKHLYRDGGVVRWRTTVKPIHRKGSAFNLPSALAALLHVGPGTPRSFDSRLGPQSVIWVSVQARSGTIKRFVDDMGLIDGEDIFLEFGDDASFDVVRAENTRSASPSNILGLVGRRGDDALDAVDVLANVADALWLPASASHDEVVSTLLTRKEFELIDALGSTPQLHH